MRALLLALMLLVLPLSAFALPAAPVAAPGTVVTEAELRRVISDFLIQKVEHLSAEVSVKKIGYSGDMRLPPGKVSYEVIAPERWEGWGNASLALIVRVDDQVKRNLTVFVEVEALAEMVVATRTLERGEVIGESDVAVARRDLARMQGRFCRKLEDVIGMRVKSAIRGNSPLRADYLERLPIVKSGQMVTIVVESEMVRITASGRAKGSGALGDTIMVQNLSSQKELAARVVDATTVRVDF
ncbi:MAG TPA: flagellar basal body P-ring formation chaperone FlgA [Geomonas sp.]